MSDFLYYSQFTTQKRLVIRDGEIRFVRFSLHKESNLDYPEHGVCKIFDDPDAHIEEAKFMSGLKSEEGIINYYHHIVSDKLYLIMEACNNKATLLKYINSYKKNKKKFKEEYLLKQTKCLLEALNIIHSKGYVHSDISPKNIFVTKSCELKIGDFGSIVTEGSSIKSYTRNYVKPKILNALTSLRKVSAKKKQDYWALGKTIYECCVLENNVNLHSVTITDINSKISAEIRLQGYSEDLIRLVYSLMNESYNHTPLEIIQIGTNTSLKTLVFTSSVVSSIICSFCGMYDTDAVEGDKKSLQFKCLHAVHKKCWLKPEDANKIPSYALRCPFCKSFVGESVMKEIIEYFKT